MGDLRFAAEALDEMERIERKLAQVGQRHDGGWKLEYLNLRRALQDHMTILNQLDGRFGAEQASEYRGAFARFRAAVALHQAEWPVVQIDPADNRYLESVSKVRSAGIRFRSEARAIFGPIDRSSSQHPGERP